MTEPHDKATTPGEIDEDVTPPGGLRTPVEKKAERRERTRTWLAIFLAVLLVGILVVSAFALFSDMSDDRLQMWSVLTAPTMTLLGTVIGFYFGRAYDD